MLNMEYVGGFVNLLNPFALLTGLVTLTVFLTHGAIFIALKTDGVIQERAKAFAGRIGLLAAGLAVVLLVWLNLAHGDWHRLVIERRRGPWPRRRAGSQPDRSGGLGLRRHRRGHRVHVRGRVRGAVPGRACRARSTRRGA